ncbi:MAG TPA: PEGA domain-containing protein, partial [Vicinamibacterales bacterium]
DRVGRGALKLKVEPQDAEVYVDGYYMGVVDDFNGTFQRMELEAGAHHLEIRAPGFQTITFDVRIEPNETVTYRGDLQALSKR